jgi:hypothetical protein
LGAVYSVQSSAFRESAQAKTVVTWELRFQCDHCRRNRARSARSTLCNLGAAAPADITDCGDEQSRRRPSAAFGDGLGTGAREAAGLTALRRTLVSVIAWEMNWTDRVTKWRRLSAREKLLRRWEAIPLDVAQSMAFEREPVDLATIRNAIARIAPPDTLIPQGGF